MLNNTVFLLTSLLILLNLIKCCSDGCSQCDPTNSNQNCTQCLDGFTLQGNICIPNVCEVYQFYESSTSNSCVSLCDLNTIGVAGAVTCQQSSQCSQKYIQSSSISKGRQVQAVQAYLSGTIIAIYSNFFNVIDSNSGSFLKTFSFNSNIILILSANSLTYMLSSSNQIYLWDSSQNAMTLITVVSNGIITSQSNIICVNNNPQRLFLSSFNNQDQQVIFSEISQNSMNQLALPYDSSVFILNNIIILQNISNSVQLFNLVQDSNSNVKINAINQGYICTNISGSLNLIVVSTLSFNYYLAFKNTNGIAIISPSQKTCQMTSDSGIPLSLQIFQLQPVQSTSYKDFLLASFSPNNFKIFDPLTNNLLTAITTDSQIVTVTAFLQNQNVGYIYILKQNKAIDIYIMTYSQQTQVVVLNKVKTLSALISNPSYLLSVYQDNTSLSPTQLCVVGQDVQVIQLAQQTTAGIAVDYIEKAQYNQNNINRLYYAENINLSLSCSQEGKLIVWKQVDPLKPVFYYQINYPNQSCKDVTVFQSTWAVSLFTNTILIFNIFNSNINEPIAINSSLFSGIYASSNYIFLFYNQQIQVLTGLNQVVLTTSITPQALYVFYSSANNIYIIDKTYSITVYSFDSTLMQITLLNTVSSYQSSNPLVAASLFNQSNGGNRSSDQFTFYTSSEICWFPKVEKHIKFKSKNLWAEIIFVSFFVQKINLN